MDVEAEIVELKRRVVDLEGAVNVLAGQLRHVAPGLASLKEETGRRLDRFETVLSRIDHRLETVGSRLGAVDLHVWSLRDDMPVLIAEAMKALRQTPDDRSSE